MATATNTFDTVETETPAGRRFLRRVSKRVNEDWHFMADAADGWRVKFYRRVPADTVGDCGATVTVETDAVVIQDGRTGQVAPFHDADTVTIPKATRVHCFGPSCRTAAGLMADGWRLAVEHSGGSTSSSRHGLAFVRLEAYRAGSTESVTIGQTVYRNGERLICGPADHR